MSYQMTEEQEEQFKDLAYKRSKPFCYGCYVLAPDGVCKKCGSDDLMRHVDGVGVEYGIEWVIEHLIASECEEVEFDEDSYDEMLDECYPTVSIGSSTFEASTILKECDPICYRIGNDEYFDSLASDNLEQGEWVKCNGSYYIPTILEGRA
jgi:hypothetical protein